ncbi:MAG: hypothetical protein ABS949_07585 [Solibacillus sp.]
MQTAILLFGSAGITIAEALRTRNKEVPLLLIETHKSLYQAERGANAIEAKLLDEQTKKMLEDVQQKQDASIITAQYYERIPDHLVGKTGELLFLTTAEMQFSNGDLEVTRARAELYEDEITQMIAPFKQVILVACLGGTTNTAIAPFVAQLAKRLGKTVVTIATLPAQFEGKTRKNPAQKGLEQLLKRSYVTLVEMDAEAESMHEYFKIKDEKIVEAIEQALQKN